MNTELSHQAELVAEACRRLGVEDRAPSVDALAAGSGYSTRHFQRLFRTHTGMSIKQWRLAHQDQRLRDHLPGAPSVLDAALEAGFASPTRLYARAMQALGMSPQHYRRGAAGQSLWYCCFDSRFGRMVVAGTAEGLSALLPGENDEALFRALQHRFPCAQWVKADEDLQRVVNYITEYLDSKHSSFELPLDLQGTIFQQQAWQALREIPTGTTLSYSELAARIGKPRAARAVAQACGANPMAVVIPCHRVLRGDGGLGGYRWGLDMKRLLLQSEIA